MSVTAEGTADQSSRFGEKEKQRSGYMATDRSDCPDKGQASARLTRHRDSIISQLRERDNGADERSVYMVLTPDACHLSASRLRCQKALTAATSTASRPLSSRCLRDSYFPAVTGDRDN